MREIKHIKLRKHRLLNVSSHEWASSMHGIRFLGEFHAWNLCLWRVPCMEFVSRASSMHGIRPSKWVPCMELAPRGRVPCMEFVQVANSLLGRVPCMELPLWANSMHGTCPNKWNPCIELAVLSEFHALSSYNPAGNSHWATYASVQIPSLYMTISYSDTN